MKSPKKTGPSALVTSENRQTIKYITFLCNSSIRVGNAVVGFPAIAMHIVHSLWTTKNHMPLVPWTCVGKPAHIRVLFANTDTKRYEYQVKYRRCDDTTNRRFVIYSSNKKKVMFDATRQPTTGSVTWAHAQHTINW